MTNFDNAFICLNGHMVNEASGTQPDRNAEFCKKCGEKTIAKCPNCDTKIKGRRTYENIVSLIPSPIPLHCESCGKEYPWKNKRRNSVAGKEKDDLTKREVNTWAGCASIVFIGLYLIFSCIVPSPTPTQHEAFRTIASLAAGAFGFLVPGLLMVNFEGTLPWPLPPGKFAISGTSGAAFFLLSYFFSPASPVMEGPRIRVTVFGPTGKLVARPNVESQPLGTVSQDSSGHCVVAIPMMPNLPDTVVTISATDPETLSTGQKDVKLKDAPPIQDVRIDLKKESNGTIEGCVSDSNGIFVAGAQVFVIGYSKEAVKSNEHGEFKLPAHKPNNETVRIHASKKGFEDTDCDVQVGEGGPITVRLMKK